MTAQERTNNLMELATTFALAVRGSEELDVSTLTAHANLLAAITAECESAQGLALALRPLETIADAYDDNALDDEARKIWGLNDEYTNKTPHDEIELYSGRGGKELLNLEQCMEARSSLLAYRTPPAPAQENER